ncbi:MAG TPA: rRNA maturation RNase YbeY [Dictyoglomaceae bacterium]|nr:rRNA maturation RNase YbeY [Dictyoglomaceae bacterium]HOL38925.1 rRNA maturation RNase YbeY [Dictyoglomaceae bacterium]HOP94887.1 rRNA maturation RNase YbeY [Dictyoglomaceae bacterium]HPP15658.1 rRNA maturation RNase YbeY [Dictyoglomaceae bacterium]HPU43374.1 rRNA maturation RNase YbeY [Dictyoglomaceae bacterium]
MGLQVYDLVGEVSKKEEEKIKNFLKEVFKKKGLIPNKYDISVVMVDDEKIKELNSKYRGKDSPTDVLSFSLGKDTKGRIVGEIYISLETVKQQAEENNKSLLDEIAFLALHGVLHILGYDHETDEDYEVMEKEASKLFSLWK